MVLPISKSDILEVYHSIKNYIHRTPILTSNYFKSQLGVKSLYFKCENVQKTGSFKIRGAINSISSHLRSDPESGRKGFITHSSGNHAAALGYAGKILGVPITVVMPKNSLTVKINAAQSYGAEIHFSEPELEAREKATSELQKKNNMILIHPFDDYLTIGGQATVCYELLDELDEIDYIVCPVGGGGLLAGSLLSTVYFAKNNVKIIASEPELAADCYYSRKLGSIQKPMNPITIADGLRTGVGVKNFEIINKLVDDIILVSEEEIILAMIEIFERMKIVVEPSSATSLAAVIKEKKRFKNKNVVIILSGGNVDLNNLPF